ncbi:PEGA domain-containing protein [Candidatus Peregrinibacteria bacterium]|nr:PEGA domain-containing protein [Candidatus Peregrinibacteria bacterium]
MNSFTRVLFEILLIAGFLGVSVYTVLSIHGYKYDIEQNDFEKTSIIDIGGEVSGAVVFIDGVKQDKTLPFAIRDIEPGLHYIVIQKPNFIVYRASVFVETDLVTKIDSIVLMPEKVVFTLIKPDEIIDEKLFIPFDPEGLSPKGGKIIYMKNREMWSRDLASGTEKFISRFSMPVYNVKFFADDYHVMFAASDMLNFCDQLMQNCYSLRKFSEGDNFASSEEKIYFKEKSSGKILVLDLSQNALK